MDTLHLTKKIRMTKVILIIIAVIGLLAFAYFTRIDGYHERKQFSTYLPITDQLSLDEKSFKVSNIYIEMDIRISLIVFSVIMLGTY